METLAMAAKDKNDKAQSDRPDAEAAQRAKRLRAKNLTLLAVLTLALFPVPAEAQAEGCWPKRVPQRCTFIRPNGNVGHSCQTMIVNGNNFRRNGTIDIQVDGQQSIQAKVVVAKPEQFANFCRFEYTQPVEQIQNLVVQEPPVAGRAGPGGD